MGLITVQVFSFLTPELLTRRNEDSGNTGVFSLSCACDKLSTMYKCFLKISCYFLHYIFIFLVYNITIIVILLFQVCNLQCLSMHGDKSQSERSRVLESFLAGECPVLVCTALLGRGIDLPNVSQVRISNDKVWSYHEPEWAPCCQFLVTLFSI